jgi:hypothetical protein
METEVEKVEFELITRRARVYHGNDEVIFTIWRDHYDRSLGGQFSVSCVVLPAAGISEYPIYLPPTTMWGVDSFADALNAARTMLAETLEAEVVNLVVSMLAEQMDKEPE